LNFCLFPAIAIMYCHRMENTCSEI